MLFHPAPFFGFCLCVGLLAWPATAQNPPVNPRPNPPLASAPASPTDALDLDPAIGRDSPVLQRWLKAIPNIQQDIQQDPSFRTRLRLGYTQFPSTGQASGLSLGLRDLVVDHTRLTLNADFHTDFEGDRTAWGTDLHYYLRPLGNTVNLAPILGYQHLETSRYTTDGINLGLKLLLVPSRTGAADLALSQTWVAPGSRQETGLTTLSLGYALAPHLRLATDIQAQNARQHKDSRVSILLEYMF